MEYAYFADVPMGYPFVILNDDNSYQICFKVQNPDNEECYIVVNNNSTRIEMGNPLMWVIL